jgi:membrane protein YqaA with SNARE-associated domain
LEALLAVVLAMKILAMKILANTMGSLAMRLLARIAKLLAMRERWRYESASDAYKRAELDTKWKPD